MLGPPAVLTLSTILLIVDPAAASNAPGLRARIEEFSQYQSLFGGPNSPTQRLLGRVQAVQAVLQRTELLVRLREYDAVRALLRGREVTLLSFDLAYATEAYRLLPQQAGRQVLSALEALRAVLATDDASEDAVVERLRACEATLRAVRDTLEAAAD